MPAEKYNLKFNSQFQIDAFHATERHQAYSGGYGNGKTTIACWKAISLLKTFPKYRYAFLRRTSSDLQKTTMQTFYKWCPPQLYDPALGGKRADSRNFLQFTNGSVVYWLHLDASSSSNDIYNIIRGLEINSVFIDQAEEITEDIYDHLDARVGRWDQAEIPEELKPETYPQAPDGRLLPPEYMTIGCNPDSELHWIYRRYHEDSPEFNEPQIDAIGREYKWSDDHKMYHGKSTDNPALGQSNVNTMLRRDDAFVKRFVLGEWGIPEGAIHEVQPESILDGVSMEFMDKIIVHGKLYRIMDHGATAPTCVLWISSFGSWHFVYREYYKADTIVSIHRRNIAMMSQYLGHEEQYAENVADPAIFHKGQEKYGSFYTTADEYTDTTGPLRDVPKIFWTAGDNNEFLTRNRLSEALLPVESIKHPVSGTSPAPSLYFIKRSTVWPNGANESIIQLKAQKKKQIAVINGKPIFSDDRDENIADHAYDPLRYYFAKRFPKETKQRRVLSPNSFDAICDRIDRDNFTRKSRRLAEVLPHFVSQRHHG